MTDEKRVSGKQVLLDAVTLVKDAGVYMYTLTKTVFIKIKSMIVTADDKDGETTHD
ncbi:MAG: hypothetical protein J1F69_02430 [Clostridiales bacterium]|nr:hypothetical protein [Clostridiales bacterium]